MRFYRALLHLYPASFRREFGAELESVFRARRRDAEGPLAVVWLWLETIADIVTSAAATHWDILRQDLTFIARSLRRAPGFTATAVLVTALGVGANAAAFSVTDFVLLRPLPFPEADRLVKLWQHPPGFPQMELSPANFRDWQAASRSFEGMAAYAEYSVNLSGTETPERIDVSFAGAELFGLLRARPALGRTFIDGDMRAESSRTAILSDAMWRTRFGADVGVIGRIVNLDDVPYQIIGVMAPGFDFPVRRVRMWIPLRLQEADYEDRSNNYLEVLGRLAPGVSIEQARADLAVVAARLAETYPVANKETGATVTRLRDQYSEKARLLLIALSGASLCILLIACANLGNLLLARGVARQRELAVRTALGAGRERLVRQAVTESLVIAGIGAALGVLIAVLAVPLLTQLVPDSLPFGGAPSVNLRVLGFAAALTMVTCLLFALLPTLRDNEADLGELRGGSRAGGDRKERLRAVLVMVEIAASVVLLIASGLLMRAIARVREVDPGFRAEGVYTLRTALPSPRYDRVVDRERYYRDVVAGVAALPGVSGAAFTSCLPMVCGGMIWPVAINGQPEEARAANNTSSLRFVTPGYFSVLGIPLLKGRDVTDRDGQKGAMVAVVSQSFVDRYWPNEEPLGKRFRVAFQDREVVGVTADIKVRGLERQSEPQVFLPASQVADSSMAFYWPKDLAIRTTQASGAILPAVRRIIAAVDAGQPIADPRSMTEIMTQQTASRAVQLRVLGALALVALLLAGIGIHGLLSFMVSQRVREIGVRMALGARPQSVVRLVVIRGMILAAAGIVPGVFLAYLAGSGMRAVLFGVPPADLMTYLVVIGLCAVMVLAGCLMPALRAVRVDPIRAIKAD